jgi:hypothetical protein
MVQCILNIVLKMLYNLHHKQTSKTPNFTATKPKPFHKHNSKLVKKISQTENYELSFD